MQDTSKKQKQTQNQSFNSEHTNKLNCFEQDKLVSGYRSKYLQSLKDVPEWNYSLQFQKELKENNICYHPNQFVKKIYMEIMEEVSSAKVVYLKVRLSYFTFNIQIYNHDEPSKTQNNLRKIGKGAFGTVYKFQNKDKSFAIKSIQYIREKEIKGCTKRVIEEFCIYKLASCLKIGPKITSELGFDLIAYKDCIQFSMQYCKSPQPIMGNSMKKQLRTLHSFNIVHGDIKEENIMFSEEYDKNIFIDFNCSSIVNQEIGFCTFTCFKGTKDYVLPQFKELLEQAKWGYVDLYYNDYFSLQITKKRVSNHKIMEKQTKLNYSNTSYVCFLYHLNLRHLFLQGNFHNFEKYINKNFNNLIVSSQLKEMIYQEYEASYFNQYSQIIQIINQTIQLCSFSPCLSQCSFKKKTLLLKYFSKYINFQQNERDDESICEKRLLKFVWLEQDQVILQKNIENMELLEAILSKFCYRGSITKQRNLINKMKTLQKQKQSQFIQLYQLLLDQKPVQKILREAIKLFQQKQFMKFQDTDQIVRKMLKIDKHYHIGHFKYRFSIFNGYQHLKETKINFQLSQFSSKRWLNLSKLQILIDKLKKFNHPCTNIQKLEYFYTKLADFYDSSCQSWHQKIKQFQDSLKQLWKQEISNTAYQFIINFLKYCFFTYLSKTGQQINQNDKTQCYNYIIEYAENHKFIWSFYLIIYEGSLFTGKHLFKQDMSQLFNQSMQNNIYYEYEYFTLSCRKEIHEHLMFRKPIKRQLIDMFYDIQNFQPCEHCFINNLSNMLLQSLNGPEQYKNLLIKKSEKYFCEIQLSELSPQLSQLIQNFNNYFMETVQWSFIYSNKFYKWSQKQYPDKIYPFKNYYTQVLILFFQDPLKCYQTIKKSFSIYLKNGAKNQKELDQFLIISQCLLKTVKKLSIDHKKIAEWQLIKKMLVQDLSFSQDVLLVQSISSINQYLFYIRDFKTYFQLWNQISKKFTKQKENIASLTYFFRLGSQLLFLLEQSVIINIDFIQAIQTTIFSHEQLYTPYILYKINTYSHFYTPTLSILLFQFVQKGLVFIFRKSSRLPRSLFLRVQQKVYFYIIGFQYFQKSKIEIDEKDEGSLYYLRRFASISGFSIGKYINLRWIFKAKVKTTTKLYIKIFRRAKGQALKPKKIIQPLTKNIKNKLAKRWIIEKMNFYLDNKQEINDNFLQGFLPDIRKLYTLYANCDGLTKTQINKI